MLSLCYYDIRRNVWISRLWVGGSNWNKRISTLYRCLFVYTRNEKSKILFYADFMLRLCYYASERNFWISRLWVEGSNWNKRISTLYRCLFVPETKNRKSNFMLILCSGYAIMRVSELCEYLGSWLKVLTEINGFLLSIDASLYQKRKIENLILCSVYAIMIFGEICEYLGSGLEVPTEINGFLLSIDASLYHKPKIENLILWWFYDIMIFCEICEYLGPRLKVPPEINGFLLSIDASLYQKPKIENLILWWFYDIMILW